jgi:hypothetical protein
MSQRDPWTDCRGGGSFKGGGCVLAADGRPNEKPEEQQMGTSGDGCAGVLEPTQPL